jgi:hypothetical protein
MAATVLNLLKAGFRKKDIKTIYLMHDIMLKFEIKNIKSDF